jgi:hypothetical protein
VREEGSRVRKAGAGGVASRGWKAEPWVDGRPVRVDGKEDEIFFLLFILFSSRD